MADRDVEKEKLIRSNQFYDMLMLQWNNKTKEEKQAIENEIIKISKQITPLAEEIKHCNNIMQRVEKIKQYQEHQQLEKEQLEKEQEKNKKDKNKAR